MEWTDAWAYFFISSAFYQRRFDFFLRSVANATLSLFFCMYVYVYALDLLTALLLCVVYQLEGGSQSLV